MDQEPQINDLKAAFVNMYNAGYKAGLLAKRGGHTSRNKRGNHTQPVACYNAQGKQLGDTYPSIIEAAEAVGCGRMVIFRSIQYNRRTKKGHYWKKIIK